MIRFLALTVITAASIAAANRITIRWEETSGLFAGRTAVVTLKTGRRVEGDWLSITPSTFTILTRHQIRRTFPRSEVDRLQVRQRRVRGRVLGTLGGIYGLGTIGAVATRQAGPIVPMALAGGILGFFLGRAYDRALVTVEIDASSIP